MNRRTTPADEGAAAARRNNAIAAGTHKCRPILTADEMRLLIEYLDMSVAARTLDLYDGNQTSQSDRDRWRFEIDRLGKVRKILAAEIDMEPRAGVATPKTKEPKP